MVQVLLICGKTRTRMVKKKEGVYHTPYMDIIFLAGQGQDQDQDEGQSQDQDQDQPKNIDITYQNIAKTIHD